MQTINRNNYEEYFLLYIDNELDATARLAVENFVQQNTDLEVELKMLSQLKALPDEIIFDDKETLLRTEGNSINETNYEEYFLLYIDNELSALKRAEVEMYVLQHPKLQDEFTTLKQAVLLPEVINYNYKQDLYRTEKRRVVSLKVWRLAAAAIFIGVGVFGVWLWQQSSSHIEVASVKPQQQNQPKENIAIVKPADSIHQPVQPKDEVVAQQKVETSKQPSSIKKEKIIKNEVAVAKRKIDKPVVNDVAVNKNDLEEFKIEKPVITHNNITKQQKEPPSTINDVAQAPENVEQKQNDVASLQTSNQPANNYTVYPVAYKEINTNDEDNSLHVGMLDLNKTKVKNLFKKAGRLFSNKSDQSNKDGKLQVANFEIDTKQQ